MSERLHPVEFLISPGVTIPPDPLPGMLAFVEGMNAGFAGTNRRFVLADNPFTIVSEFPRHTRDNFPTESFPIRCCIGLADRVQNGHIGYCDDGGALLRWDAPSMPTWRDGPPMPDDNFWEQLHKGLHEAAHHFGCGIPETYPYHSMHDPTGVHPLAPVSAYDPNDILWGRRPDWRADPMLHQSRGPFSKHNAQIISGPYRVSQHQVPLAPLDTCSVYVGEHWGDVVTGPPLAGVRVRIWAVDNDQPECDLIADAVTDATGRVPFAWPSELLLWKYSVLVKCHAPGYLPTAGWIIVPDLESAGMDGEPLEAVCRMTPGVERPQQITLTAERGWLGVVRIRGCRAGQRIEIQSGPMGQSPENFVTTAADSDDFIWVDPLPHEWPDPASTVFDSRHRMYRVRTLPPAPITPQMAARRVAARPLARYHAQPTRKTPEADALRLMHARKLRTA